MPKATRILSPFHNLPLAELVDRFGAAKTQLSALEDATKALREELLRRSVPDAAGTMYDATISSAVRWTLDTKAVKAELGADWYDRHCRQAMVTTVAVKPRAVAVAALTAIAA